MIRILRLRFVVALAFSVPAVAYGQVPTEFIVVPSNPIYPYNLGGGVISKDITPTTPGYQFYGYIGYFKAVYFSDDGVDKVRLDTPFATTVTFADGGKWHDWPLSVYNNSTVIVDGGMIFGSYDLQLDDSMLQVLQGFVKSVRAHKASQIVLSPSAVVDNIWLSGMSSLTANSAKLNSLELIDHTSAELNNVEMTSRLTASGTAGVALNQSVIPFLEASESSVVNLNDTEVMQISAVDDSNLSVDGGTLLQKIARVEVGYHATIQLFNNSVVTAFASQSGKLQLSSVHVDNLSAEGSATIFGLSASFDVLRTNGNASVDLTGGYSDSAFAFGTSSIKSYDTLFGSTGVRGGTLEIVQGRITENLSVNGESDASKAILTDVEQIGGQINAYGPKGKLSVSGGTYVFGNVNAYSGANLNLAGPSMASLQALDRSIVDLSGTIVRAGAVAADRGIIFMHSGLVKNDFMAIGPGSTAILESGAVNRNLVAIDGGTVTMSGGFVAGKSYVDGASTFNFSGGTIVGDQFSNLPPEDLTADLTLSQLMDNGAASGGLDPLAGKIVATAGSIVNIYGTQLATLLVDPNFVDPDTGLEFSIYQLLGMLADGSPLAGQLMFIQNDTETSFNLLPPPVPEPATVILSLLGTAGILGRRKRLGSRLGLTV